MSTSRGTRVEWPNFMRQQETAAQWEKDYHEHLVADGWVWDDVLRRYTNPRYSEQFIVW